MEPEFRTLYNDPSRNLIVQGFRFRNMTTSLQDRVARIFSDHPDITPAELARIADVTRGWVSQWQHGPAKSMAFDAAQAIHRKLGYELRWLITGEGPAVVAREPGADLSGEAIPVDGQPVPVVGTAQLGDGGYWEAIDYPVGHGEGYVRYPTKDPNAYALRVKGDSMRPRIKPGEFVLIEPNRPVSPGDEVMVQTLDGRCMVKVLDFRRDGMVQLSSVNEDHRPITLDESSVVKMHHVGGIIKASLYYSAT